MLINPAIEELLHKQFSQQKRPVISPPDQQSVKPHKIPPLTQTKELLNRPSHDKQTKLANKLVSGTATEEDLLTLYNYNVAISGYNQNASSYFWEYTTDNYKKMHCFYDVAKEIIPALSRQDYFRYLQYLLSLEMKSPTTAFRNHTLTTMFLMIEIELHLATLISTQLTSNNIFSNTFLYFLNEVIFPALNSNTTTMTYERKYQYVRENLIDKIYPYLQSLAEQPPDIDQVIRQMVSTTPVQQPDFDNPINQRPTVISQELAELLNTPLNINSLTQGTSNIVSAATAKQSVNFRHQPIAPIAIPATTPATGSTEARTIVNVIPTTQPKIATTALQLTQFPTYEPPQTSYWPSWMNLLFSSTSPIPESSILISKPEPKHADSQIENAERLKSSLTKSALGPLKRFYDTKNIHFETNGADHAKLTWLKNQETDLSAYNTYQLNTELIFNFNVIVDLLGNEAMRKCDAFVLLIQSAILFHRDLISKQGEIDGVNIQLAREMVIALEKIARALPAQATGINKYDPPAQRFIPRP